jgi:hypothetical protein
LAQAIAFLGFGDDPLGLLDRTIRVDARAGRVVVGGDGNGNGMTLRRGAQQHRGAGAQLGLALDRLLPARLARQLRHRLHHALQYSPPQREVQLELPGLLPLHHIVVVLAMHGIFLSPRQTRSHTRALTRGDISHP